MAKKKHNEHSPTEGGADASSAATFTTTPVSITEAATETEVQPAPSAVPTDLHQEATLLDQVQSFLTQRAELAQKLAAEIEATEKRLVELRKTAAMLFPENTASPAKDKKPKKPAKPKVVSRDEDPPSRAAEAEAA